MFLFELSKALVRCVGVLSGEKAVSVPALGKAKTVDEAEKSGKEEDLVQLTIAGRWCR